MTDMFFTAFYGVVVLLSGAVFLFAGALPLMTLFLLSKGWAARAKGNPFLMASTLIAVVASAAVYTLGKP